MSPIIKTLIVVFGGMAVMVVTTVCGAAAGFIMIHYSDPPIRDRSIIDLFLYVFFGGVIGAVVGIPIWVWLGYMVCRDKKPAELPPGPPTS